MAFVNQSQAGTSSITLPSGIQAGDFIILFGYRNTTTAPSLATGFTNISNQSANGNSMRVMYKIATGSESGTSVAVTNANVIQCVVHRGVSRIGGSGSTTNASGASTTLAGIGTMQDTSGNSWVVSYGGSLQTTSMSTPSGTTLRGTVQTGTTSMGLICDTNGGVSSWAQHTSTNGVSAAGAGGSFELVMVGAKLSTLVDAFDQVTLDTTKWVQTTGGSATVAYASGGATVTYPASSTAATLGQDGSVALYDLGGSSAYAQILAVPSSLTAADADLRLQLDVNNYLRWVYEGGTLFAQKFVAASRTTIASFTYNSTTHKYWRISETGGTVSWDTSPDGSTWTSQGTSADPFVITALRAYMLGSCFQAETSPGTFKWNNFNTTGGGTPWSQPLTDSVTSSETIVKSPVKIPSDSVTTSEINAKTVTTSRSDSVTVTDAITKSLMKSLADSVTTSEVSTHNPTLNRTDSIVSSDSLNRTATYIRSITDSVTSTDAISNQPIRNISDSVSVSEAVTKTPGKNLNDSVTSSDANSKAVGLAKSDSISTSDTHTTLTMKSLADSTTASETAIKSPGKNLADSITATDSSIATPGHSLNRTDNVTPSDVISFAVGKYLTDSVTVSEIHTASVHKNATDTVTTSEVSAHNPVSPHADSVTSSDTVAKASTSLRTDAVSTSDIVTKSLTKNFADSVTSSDLLTPASPSIHPLTDAVITTDALVKSLTKNLTDSVSTSEATAKPLTHPRTDSVTISDVVNKTLHKSIVDTATTSEQLLAARPFILRDLVLASDKFRLYLNGVAVVVPTNQWIMRPIADTSKFQNNAGTKSPTPRIGINIPAALYQYPTVDVDDANTDVDADVDAGTYLSEHITQSPGVAGNSPRIGS